MEWLLILAIIGLFGQIIEKPDKFNAFMKKQLSRIYPDSLKRRLMDVAKQKR